MRIKLKLFLISILISLSGLSTGDDVTLPQLAFENLEQTMRVSQDGLNLLKLSTNRPADTLAYSLDGKDAAYFTVDSQGQVVFKKAHNYKERSSYKITFKAQDTAEISASGEVSYPSTLFLVVRDGDLYQNDHWEPSRVGACEYYENISPALDEITLGLTQNNDQKSIFEPTQIFDDETTTLMVSKVESNESTIPFNSMKSSNKFRTIDGGEPDFLYDDGSHGDLVAGDGVWTLSCLRPALINSTFSELNPFNQINGLEILSSNYRGTEPAPEIISPTLSVNDTGFFYKNNQQYLIDSDQTAWVLANPATSDALKQIWDYKGSIFNLYTMSNTHGGWGAGMWRIHDFIRGTGHNAPPCDNYSHCFSFSDDQDHPELIAGMTVGGGLRVDGLIHEVQHALLGFTMKNFPEANANSICDGNPDCSRELSIDYAHIEANTTLNSDLKGPPWNPEFGYPHSIRIRKSDGSTTEPNVIYDDEDEVFKVVERTRAMQYGTSDFLLYQQGLLSAEDALKDEYKIIGYTFPGCELENKSRFCPDGYEFPYEESIKFNVTDSIAKFGGYENPRGLNVYDPAAIKMAMIQMSGRNHTEAEYTIDSKIYRSWANDGADQERTSFDGKDLEGDPPWAFSIKGLGRIIVDFSSRIDTDSDGLPNDCDAGCITAGLIEDFDDDNDGVFDENDAFPLDASETIDTDYDGVGDNADDRPYDPMESLDTDNDGIGNNADTDDDGDLVLDGADAFPLDAAESLDADGDGIGNNADTDDDNDGVVDNADAFPFDKHASLDTDGDGKADYFSVSIATAFTEVNSLETSVTRYEGPIDAFIIDLDQRAVITFTFDEYPEECTLVLNSVVIDCDVIFITDPGEYTIQLLDSYGDGGISANISIQLATLFPSVSPAGTVLDDDDDNDGVLDVDDAFPLISLGGLTDSDSDGRPDKCDTACINAGMTADTDDDNDNILDGDDAFPLDATETIDTDGDGVGNNADADDDGDGVSDSSDDLPLDPTNDSDDDGVANNSDAYPENSLYSKDSDNDGMPDAWETRYGLDPNDASDAKSDQDNDGVTALDEFIGGTIPLSLDVDGNDQYDALTDGLLLLRGMFGLDGSALVTGTIASDAAYTESVDIESRISTLGDLADIDGNGQIDALTDGLLTLRYLFGLEGDTLIAGVVASDATRTSAVDIEAHLKTLMPAL